MRRPTSGSAVALFAFTFTFTLAFASSSACLAHIVVHNMLLLLLPAGSAEFLTVVAVLALVSMRARITVPHFKADRLPAFPFGTFLALATALRFSTAASEATAAVTYREHLCQGFIYRWS